jgi:glucose/arabinose dehydrogenase
MKTIAGFFSIVLLYVLTGCNSKIGSSQSLQVLDKDSKVLYDKYQLDKIILPPGFSISVFAEVPNARSLCRGSKGSIFVGNRSGDKVYAVVDENNDGKADKRYVIDEGLNQPNGVAFRNGSLYVAEISRILRYDDIENRLANPPEPVVVYDKYPTETHHGWKFIAFGPDGKLYVPVGAPCNVCEKENKVYSSITRINPDGTGMEVYAHGVRNTVGFAWHPQTNALWFTDNGRDNMGDDVPGDELNMAPKQNMHFGFPYCHQGDKLDPEFGKNKDCGNYTAPRQILGAHVAALGMRFYNGDMFLPEYKNQIFIAEHGSWNRSEPSGYRVMMCRLDADNKVVQYVPFARGWLQPNGDVLGRPVDVEVLPDGSMLISDDKSGAIYRVTFKN